MLNSIPFQSAASNLASGLRKMSLEEMDQIDEAGRKVSASIRDLLHAQPTRIKTTFWEAVDSFSIGPSDLLAENLPPCLARLSRRVASGIHPQYRKTADEIMARILQEQIEQLNNLYPFSISLDYLTRYLNKLGVMAQGISSVLEAGTQARFLALCSTIETNLKLFVDGQVNPDPNFSFEVGVIFQLLDPADLLLRLDGLYASLPRTWPKKDEGRIFKEAYIKLAFPFINQYFTDTAEKTARNLDGYVRLSFERFKGEIDIVLDNWSMNFFAPFSS